MNTLYNYAHVLTDTLLPEDLMLIADFFGADPYRVKFIDNTSMRDVFTDAGYAFKDIGYIMVADDIAQRDYTFTLPDHLRLQKVTSLDEVEHYLSIASQAFANTLEATREKLGFLDSVILDPHNNHVNTYILYENDIPVSTGSCYAFNMLSIENIATLPVYRGRGYAGIIMQQLMQDAQQLGYQQACLVASELGSHVYQKVGFSVLHKTVTFKSVN